MIPIALRYLCGQAPVERLHYYGIARRIGDVDVPWPDAERISSRTMPMVVVMIFTTIMSNVHLHLR
jgi:hypothetical protein